MYPSTSAYKTAMRSASRPYDTVEGTITFSNPLLTPIDLDTSIMPTNAISISKQCIDGGELMFGGVFLSTLKLSVITDLDRYSFFGAEIELTYKIKVGVDENDDPEYFEVPLGVYTVAEAERPTDRVTVTAYDHMRLLDKEIGGNYISGNPWEVLSFVSEQTGYPLGFTESDLSEYINYTYSITASEENSITTYRGVVKEVCQMLGCFACDDRTGKLTLKKFSQNSDITLTSSDWYKLVPADYICKYVALSITSLVGTFTKAVDDPNEVGNIMIIDDAPAWDYGSAEAQQAKTDNLFNYLISIDEYTPCDMDMPSDPTFECGDRLTLVTKHGTISTLVTSLEWKFHQGMTITSEGINPYTEGNSALATESARILSQAVERSKLQFVSFTNSSDKVVGTELPVEICRAEFTPTAETNALFVGTFVVDVNVSDTETTTTESVQVPITVTDQQGQPAVITDLQGNPLNVSGMATNTYTYKRDGKSKVSIYYTLDGVRMPSDENPYTAIDEIENGKHIITVSYPITSLVPYQKATWKVFMICDNGTVTIPQFSTKAVIFGQEITSVEHFNGHIEVPSPEELPEYINLVAFEKLGVIDISDAGEITFNNAILYNITDDLSLLGIGNISPIPVEDTVSVYKTSGRFHLLTENRARLLTEDRQPLLTE